MNNNILNLLRKKAIELGADEFGISDKKTKRFYVIFNNSIIHFGSKTGRTFIDHGDEHKQSAWIKRHSKIINKHGIHVMGLKTSPSFWSFHILWE